MEAKDTKTTCAEPAAEIARASSSTSRVLPAAFPWPGERDEASGGIREPVLQRLQVSIAAEQRGQG